MQAVGNHFVSMRAFLFSIAVAFAFITSAFAHDPGLSSATVTVAKDGLHAVVIFNPRDLSILTPDGANAYPALAPQILQVQQEGKVLAARLQGVTTDANQNVIFKIDYAKSGAGLLQFASGVVERLPFGHRQFLTIQDTSGQTIGSHLLSARDNGFSVTLAAAFAPAQSSRFVEFLLLGIRHILTGYDHLLFLFGLLIVSRNARSAALLITCFTAAHSLTLALSTFNLVNLQSRFVESAIAASIVYVGLENLYRGRNLDYRWLLTFLFGLVHGLGFASVLREMNVAQGGIKAVIPLVAFNSGVELGQLSIAVLVLPLIWKMRKHDTFFRIAVPACSLLIALAGGYWFFQRILQA